VAKVQSASKAYDIDSKYQWIFSEQNIMGSKTRLCVNCKEESKWEGWRGWEIPDIHLRSVCFAIKEYQRRHTPISTVKSDYERYILSLPDRTNLTLQHFGDVDINDGFAATYYRTDMIECLTIALIPDYNPGTPYYTNLSQELRTKIIQDKNRVIPDDQELTRWMKKHFDKIYNRDRCEWYTIQFCKIFMNPKSLEHPKRLDDGKEVYNIRYTVVVHYSVPKGDWKEYDI